jgi:prolyl-tRNA editing enzyme YbaK/EbsC (Cys-tRNA(Pro) deacylase)
MRELSKSAGKVQDVLDKFGIKLEVKELPVSTRTAGEAAEAVGCRVEQIAKSIVFDAGGPVLVIASGINRISTQKLQDRLDKEITIMEPDKVKRIVGYPIGGVPPVGHKTSMKIFIDEDLLNYDIIWAAAGNPRAVFSLTPQELIKITSGEVMDVKE